MNRSRGAAGAVMESLAEEFELVDELVECQSRVGLLARPIPAVKIRRITG